MTIVEFFDKSPLENIAGALLCNPESVIFIGDKKKKIEKGIEVYQKILNARGCQTHLTYRAVNKNSLEYIVPVLDEIVKTHEECVFDLTGGEDMYLVGVGIVMARNPERAKCHYFNFKNSKLLDSDMDGVVCAVQSFDLSVEESLTIHDGTVVEKFPLAAEGGDGEPDAEFLWDVESLWEICRGNSRLWNVHAATLGAINEAFGLQDSLAVDVDMGMAEEEIRRRGGKLAFIPGIMVELERAGVIRALTMGDRLSFTYKNFRVKRCLTVSGQILELITATRLLGIRDDEAKRLYHSVEVGVMLDWNAPEEDELYRTFNEVDVIAMKDAVPVFISCKNGNFEADELYKLNTVAERFGGDYVKKVLIATELEKLGPKAHYIRARAQDMKIRLVEDVDTMSDDELERVLKSLWCN